MSVELLKFLDDVTTVDFIAKSVIGGLIFVVFTSCYFGLLRLAKSVSPNSMCSGILNLLVKIIAIALPVIVATGRAPLTTIWLIDVVLAVAFAGFWWMVAKTNSVPLKLFSILAPTGLATYFVVVMARLGEQPSQIAYGVFVLYPFFMIVALLPLMIWFLVLAAREIKTGS